MPGAAPQRRPTTCSVRTSCNVGSVRHTIGPSRQDRDGCAPSAAAVSCSLAPGIAAEVARRLRSDCCLSRRLRATARASALVPPGPRHVLFRAGRAQWQHTLPPRDKHTAPRPTGLAGPGRLRRLRRRLFVFLSALCARYARPTGQGVRGQGASTTICAGSGDSPRSSCALHTSSAASRGRAGAPAGTTHAAGCAASAASGLELELAAPIGGHAAGRAVFADASSPASASSASSCARCSGLKSSSASTRSAKAASSTVAAGHGPTWTCGQTGGVGGHVTGGGGPGTQPPAEGPGSHPAATAAATCGLLHGQGSGPGCGAAATPAGPTPATGCMGVHAISAGGHAASDHVRAGPGAAADRRTARGRS